MDHIEAPPEVAAEWRRVAGHENAAIVAFSQTAVELVAVGAPPELIADAHRAALDEVRHARTCYAIARAIDGHEAGPAPFPEARQAAPSALPRPMALARIAVDAVIDGALNEGVAGRLLAKLSRRAANESLRARLTDMAADESRHAAHSWRVVEWCLEEGGARVADALRWTLQTLPPRMTTDAPAAAHDGSWERWGVQGDQIERAEWEKARAYAAARLTTMLQASVRAA